MECERRDDHSKTQPPDKEGQCCGMKKMGEGLTSHSALMISRLAVPTCSLLVVHIRTWGWGLESGRSAVASMTYRAALVDVLNESVG